MLNYEYTAVPLIGYVSLYRPFTVTFSLASNSWANTGWNRTWTSMC